MFEAFAVSTGVVALGEIGDKTQLLALVLAARFRRPWPIVAGILVATVANHAAAAALGAWLTRVLDPTWLRWGLGLSFIAVALWMLVPDRADDVEARAARGAWGIFGVTVLAFFLAEMGDKTQVATVMLAARFDQWAAVTAGTTLGMMLANVPAVWLGERALRVLPAQWVHRVAALVFAAMGVAVLAGVAG
jgi:putative Ca2+/H+ antiporter (TMEM165/GDT1 family)